MHLDWNFLVFCNHKHNFCHVSFPGDYSISELKTAKQCMHAVSVAFQ